MRTREAWLAAMAAVLGVSDGACKKDDSVDAPAAVREVPSASASASVAATAPSESASTEVAASASVAPSASVVASATPTVTGIGLGNIGTLGTIGHGACGLAHVNPACGARASNQEPTTNVNLQLIGSDSADDRRVVQTNLRARMRACANNAAKNDPNIQGSGVLELAIDAHGAVTRVDSPAGNLPESALGCMKTGAHSVKFAEGAARTIRVQLQVQRSAY
jgi:hypothetical protein